MYKYDIAADKWTDLGKPSKLIGRRCGATIIERRSSGHQILMWVGADNNVIQYTDLTDYHNSGTVSWITHTSAHSSYRTSLVALSSHEALEVKSLIMKI